MMMQDYQLIVIGNPKVLLTAGSGTANGSFWLTLAVMLAVVAFIALWFYLTRCRSCRKRIRELNPDGRAYRGWNVRRLEQTVAELDLAAVNFL